MGVSAPDDKGSGESDVFSGLPRSRPQRPSVRRQAAKPSAKKPPAKVAKTSKAAPAKPRAARKTPAEKAIPRSGYATPEPTGAHDGTDVIAGAVQAVAELAQIGAKTGGQALRSILGRLPKP